MLDPTPVGANLLRREQVLREVAARTQNVIRDAGLVCPRCGGADASVCRKCTEWVAAGDAADRVIPLVYAASGTQIRTELRNYKNDRLLATQRVTALRSLQSLMWNFSYRHEACLAAVSVNQPALTTLVPSGTPRSEPHPFENVARMAPAAWARMDATRVYAISRACDPDSVSFSTPDLCVGQHVVILDDSWVTGSKAEGVAMAARRAGAAEVSVITIARIVNSDYGPAERLLTHMENRKFKKKFCPVTRDVCP